MSSYIRNYTCWSNICRFHRFPWSSVDMYPFHYITMSRRSKKYVKLFLIWILVLHQTVWHQFCKSLSIFQNLTPVELNSKKKNKTFDLFDYCSRTDMSNYTFSESLCPEEYISNNFGQIWQNQEIWPPCDLTGVVAPVWVTWYFATKDEMVLSTLKYNYNFGGNLNH